ncbi:MAG TPA: hemolysin family protein [Bryobacteraceae bacterium]|jgi:CBS domain containing-hemolysin-like protein|nr:hemolysin family protein [Bryobacteraceae bacterium]
MNFGYRILILLAILFANAFFAAAEVALVSVRRSRLRALADDGQVAAQAALSLLENPERLLSVTQVGVTLASLGLGWAGEDTLFELFIRLFHPVISPATEAIVRGVCFTFAFLMMSYCHVVIGEVTPKNLALDKSDRLALLVAPALLVFYKFSAPFVIVIERSAAALSRLLGLREHRLSAGHSTEELKFIIRSSLKEGHLERFEEDAIRKLLELPELSAREIMVPRNDIVSLPATATLDEVLRQVNEHKFSRIPVYDERPENIIGVLHFKDLIPVWRERRMARQRNRPERPFQLRRFLRKPLVVPETKPLTQLIGEFSGYHTHLALVVDEFGTIVGLVTLEDVLEQVFGEIADEHDVRRPAPSVTAPVVEVEGTIPIRDLSTMYGLDLPTDAGFETLAGFLLSQLGYIPKAGDQTAYGDRRFTILEMDRNRIARVLIERIQPASGVAPAAGGRRTGMRHVSD